MAFIPVNNKISTGADNVDMKQFINEDPMKDGLNWFAYVDGNPVVFTDPTGCLTVSQYPQFLWNVGVEGAKITLRNLSIGSIFRIAKDLKSVGEAVYKFGRGLYYGEYTIGDIIRTIGQTAYDGLSGDLRYVIENKYLFDPNLELTQEQLEELSIHTAGAYEELVVIATIIYGTAKTIKNIASRSSFFNKGSGKVWTGKDKYVPELANAIEKKLPNKIKSVERLLYGSDGKLITDLDIELDDIIIQVKSGSGKKLTTQMINTANATGKQVISYTPDINQNAAVLKGVRAVEGYNFKTFTDETSLIDYLLEFYSN